MIFESQLPSKNLPNISTYNLLFENDHGVERNKACYINAENQDEFLTFGDVHDITLKFGAGLKRVFPDFKQGDVVVFFTDVELVYLAALHGPPVIGGISSSIDTSSDINKLVHCLNLVTPKALITCSDTIHRALEAAQLIGMPKERIFVFGDKEIEGCRSFNKTFLDHNQFATPITYTPEELATKPCFYCFTSGTTGKPKAVIITHMMILTSIVGLNVSEKSRVMKHLCTSAPHHASMIYKIIHIHLYFGFRTYVLKKDRQSIEKVLQAIQDCGIHVVFAQPVIIASIAKEPETSYDLSSLRAITCAGNVLNKAVAVAFCQRFKIPILNFYGMTEIIGPFQSNAQNSIAGQIGVLNPGYTCKLIDIDGKMVGYDTPGELCIKGPSLTPGYYKNPELYVKMLDKDGFFHTGDLFECNQDGIFSFVNRAGDVFKYHDNFIIPQEIENVLMKHPSVVDSVVIAAYSEKEIVYVPRAFVLLTNTTSDNVEQVKKEILEMVQTQLPDIMQLRGGLYVAKTLPRTSTGKIERRTLGSTAIEKWLLR
ncbi:MAG: hypothetical protein EXX96DRAFT_568453 [Benjaminiella poitrasii]|nr:MAG: hypothetical protein EXX96DRAFT_568453 [Benjaminiella poitrasii]